MCNKFLERKDGIERWEIFQIVPWNVCSEISNRFGEKMWKCECRSRYLYSIQADNICFDKFHNKIK